jgi:hypothetical protein
LINFQLFLIRPIKIFHPLQLGNKRNGGSSLANNLEGLSDVRGLEAILAPNFTKVVTLTEHTAGVQKVYIENYLETNTGHYLIMQR